MFRIFVRFPDGYLTQYSPNPLLKGAECGVQAYYTTDIDLLFTNSHCDAYRKQNFEIPFCGREWYKMNLGEDLLGAVVDMLQDGSDWKANDGRDPEGEDAIGQDD